LKDIPMTLSDRITQSLNDNKLAEALDQARSELKSNPQDATARHLYIDLLVLNEDYEKADAQCDLAANFAPEEAIGFALLRGHLRAMAARREWFLSGAVPDFPQGPSAADKAALQLNIARREQASADEAASALEALEACRAEQPMQWNGTLVEDFRDLDDLIPHALEVITTGGTYLWVDFSKIAEITLLPMCRPRDLAFRQAELRLLDNASAPVLLPALYFGSSISEGHALGRETDWVQEENGLTTGRGQRCFLAGDDLVPFHEIETLSAGNSPSRMAAHG
jgi:type VI secretion system protein ImpE